MKLEFDSGTLRPISSQQLDVAAAAAHQSPRGRSILRYHDHEEAVQRMINAVEPESYVRPHKHENPDKVEVFIVLRGRAIVCRFDDHGTLTEKIELSEAGNGRGVEIPARIWHSVVAIDSGTVLFEVSEGPFSETSHKNFADWAPAEGTPEGAAYLKGLRETLELER